jgi:hypothetical protein
MVVSVPAPQALTPAQTIVPVPVPIPTGMIYVGPDVCLDYNFYVLI